MAGYSLEAKMPQFVFGKEAESIQRPPLMAIQTLCGLYVCCPPRVHPSLVPIAPNSEDQTGSCLRQDLPMVRSNFGLSAHRHNLYRPKLAHDVAVAEGIL